MIKTHSSKNPRDNTLGTSRWIMQESECGRRLKSKTGTLFASISPLRFHTLFTQNARASRAWRAINRNECTCKLLNCRYDACAQFENQHSASVNVTCSTDSRIKNHAKPFKLVRVLIDTRCCFCLRCYKKIVYILSILKRRQGRNLTSCDIKLSCPFRSVFVTLA